MRLGISQLSKKTNSNKYTKGKRGNLRLILQLPVTDDGKGVAILIFKITFFYVKILSFFSRAHQLDPG